MPAKEHRDRVVPPAKAYKWWVSWHWSSVIVTAATKEDAVALVRGLGYFGKGYIAPPRCKVVRATWRHMELYEAAYNADAESASRAAIALQAIADAVLPTLG
jgi:hypothetical protein